MKNFLLDMVTDDDRRVSSARVMMALTFVVSSVIVLWLTHDGKMGVDYFFAYLGFGSGTFSWAKWIEAKTQAQNATSKS